MFRSSVGVAENYATTRKGRKVDSSSQQIQLQQIIDRGLFELPEYAEVGETLLEHFQTLHPGRTRDDSLQALRGRKATVKKYVARIVGMIRQELYPQSLSQSVSQLDSQPVNQSVSESLSQSSTPPPQAPPPIPPNESSAPRPVQENPEKDKLIAKLQQKISELESARAKGSNPRCRSTNANITFKFKIAFVYLLHCPVSDYVKVGHGSIVICFHEDHVLAVNTDFINPYTRIIGNSCSYSLYYYVYILYLLTGGGLYEIFPVRNSDVARIVEQRFIDLCKKFQLYVLGGMDELANMDDKEEWDNIEICTGREQFFLPSMYDRTENRWEWLIVSQFSNVSKSLFLVIFIGIFEYTSSTVGALPNQARGFTR